MVDFYFGKGDRPALPEFNPDDYIIKPEYKYKGRRRGGADAEPEAREIEWSIQQIKNGVLTQEAWSKGQTFYGDDEANRHYDAYLFDQWEAEGLGGDYKAEFLDELNGVMGDHRARWSESNDEHAQTMQKQFEHDSKVRLDEYELKAQRTATRTSSQDQALTRDKEVGLKVFNSVIGYETGMTRVKDKSL